MEYNNLLKDFKIAEQNYHIHGDTVSRKHVCFLRNKYRKICRIKKKNYETNCAIELGNLSKKDPKKFWKCLKRNSKTLNKCDFHSFFKDMSKEYIQLSDEGQSELLNYEFCKNEVEELDAPFEMVELENAIKQAKADKAHGTDKLINEFFYKCQSNYE